MIWILALVELEKTKGTVEDLGHKLKVNESKESGIKAREAAKNQPNWIEESNYSNPLALLVLGNKN